jgi:putative ABC transport system substrate-binding protein
MMRRRDFITLLGGAAAAWPVVAQSQQPVKLPTIGLLGAGTRSGWTDWVAAFVQRLRELGWTEGRTMRSSIGGRRGALTEPPRSSPSSSVSRSTSSLRIQARLCLLAAKQATSVIPIVFATAGIPVGTGLVDSLARLSNQTGDLAAKRVELLRQVAPRLARLAIVANALCGLRERAQEADRRQFRDGYNKKFQPYPAE